MDDDSIFSPSYPIELLSRSPFLLDREPLRAALSDRLGTVDCPGDDMDSALLFFLRDHPVKLEDASVPAQLAFLTTDAPADHSRYEAVLGQSWDIDDAGERLSACQFSVSMVNMMSSSLPQLQRRQIVAGGLLALLDLVDADLVYWPQTEQMLDPDKVRSMLAEPDERANPAYGFVNVRFFNVEESGERVMDTLGLGALGLTDLQMHYRDLEPARVARFLHSLAAYLMENGDIIENGHTVQGLEGDDRWTCLHQMALVAPERVVLDVDPGAPHAAGERG